jgi:predicted O-methyltransferase YrrM
MPLNEAKIHPHAPEERAHLFEAHDKNGSTELEYLQLLKALVRTTKPERILETGSAFGVGTLALAQAARRNGMGEIFSLEMRAGPAARARQRLGQQGLTNATVIQTNSLEWLGRCELGFGFAFFDTDLLVRAQELRMCLERKLLVKGAFAAIHDTSRLRRDARFQESKTDVFWEAFEAVCQDFGITSVVEFPLSRGLVLLRV